MLSAREKRVYLISDRFLRAVFVLVNGFVLSTSDRQMAKNCLEFGTRRKIKSNAIAMRLDSNPISIRCIIGASAVLPVDSNLIRANESNLQNKTCTTDRHVIKSPDYKAEAWMDEKHCLAA